MTDDVKQIAEELASAEAQENKQVSDSEVETEEKVSAESAEPEGEQQDESNKSLNELPLPEEEKDYEKNWPKGFKERLQRQAVKLQKSEQEAAMFKADLAKLQIMLQTSQTQQQVIDEGIPRRENYASEEAYTDALVDFKLKRKENEDQQKIISARIQAHQQLLAKKADEADQAGEKKYSDYSETVQPLYDPSFPGNRPMYEAILDSEHSADILYFLGKYKDKAKEIALMPPARAIKKIAEIDMRFEERKKNNRTKAPPILNEVQGGASKMNTKDPSKMSPSEYREWREQSRQKVAKK